MKVLRTIFFNSLLGFNKVSVLWNASKESYHTGILSIVQSPRMRGCTYCLPGSFSNGGQRRLKAATETLIYSA
jgi:hypothetical protein